MLLHGLSCTLPPPAARDVPLGYELVDHPAAAQQAARLARQEYSAGIIAFNWAVDRKLDALLQHNVFMSGDHGLWGVGSVCSGWRRSRRVCSGVRNIRMRVVCCVQQTGTKERGSFQHGAELGLSPDLLVCRACR